jgi:hypothetical protein
MSEGLLDRYFRLLAGQVPEAEYGVIAEVADEEPVAKAAELSSAECLC